MRELTIETQRGTLVAKEWGPASGYPVLALHGWLDNANSFNALAPFLPTCHLVAPDLPGHGKSFHRPPGMAYHFQDWIKEVLDVVHFLKWKKFSFLSHSMGGGITVAFAAAFPEFIDKIVLLESMGPLTDDPANCAKRLRAFFDDWAKLEKAAPALYPTIDVPAELRRKVAPISIEGARAIISRSLKQVPGGYTWASDVRLRGPAIIRLTEEHVESLLRAIHSPTLAIRAMNGLRDDEARISRRFSLLGKGKLVTVEGEHHVHVDHPERVAPSIVEFFRVL